MNLKYSNSVEYQIVFKYFFIRIINKYQLYYYVIIFI